MNRRSFLKALLGTAVMGMAAKYKGFTILPLVDPMSDYANPRLTIDRPSEYWMNSYKERLYVTGDYVQANPAPHSDDELVQILRWDHMGLWISRPSAISHIKIT